MTRGGRLVAVFSCTLAAGAIHGLTPSPANATVDMQNQARKLGFKITNCLDCHASPHAVDVMKKRARDARMAEGNCLACHGARIPATLNDRGQWLVAEKHRRQAKEFDMAWLKDYKEPGAASAPSAKHAAKPETIQLPPQP
jgi:mono/diheme cytochrome c family protein